MEPPRDLLLTLLDKPSTRFGEGELLLLWKYICPRLKQLTTSTGSSVTVTDPGRIDRLEGPDVQNVSVEFNGMSRSGSVEIHRQTAGWYHHDHHRQRSFNTVILHVVLTGERVSVRRQDDNWVETVVLRDHLDGIQSLIDSFDETRIESRRRAVKRPCYRNNPGAEPFQSTLEKAGRAWLGKRANRLRKLGDHSLLQATIEALGYTRNHGCFRRLAERLDLSRLLSIVERVEKTVPLEAFFIGKGGWFRRSGPFNEAINVRRRCWNRRWATDSAILDVDRWNRSGVRPQCSPLRRWINFGWTLRRLEQSVGFQDWIRITMRGLLNASDFRREAHRSLRSVFGFPGANYWKFHYSLSDSRRETVPSPVGPGWFDQVLVNVFLPDLYYRTYELGLPELRDRIVGCLREFPPTLVNRRTRRLKQQWGFDENDAVFDSVLQQQGGVHLYKQGCVRGRCEQCSLKRQEVVNNDRLFEIRR